MPNVNDPLVGVVPVVSTALENSHIIVTPASAGFGGPFALYSYEVANFDTATAYMVLLFDSTTLPSNGTVTPIWFDFVAVATASVPQIATFVFTPTPLKFKNGIVVAVSSVLTTPFSLTVGTNSKVAFSFEVSA